MGTYYVCLTVVSSQTYIADSTGFKATLPDHSGTEEMSISPMGNDEFYHSIVNIVCNIV